MVPSSPWLNELSEVTDFVKRRSYLAVNFVSDIGVYEATDRRTQSANATHRVQLDESPQHCRATHYENHQAHQ